MREQDNDAEELTMIPDRDARRPPSRPHAPASLHIAWGSNDGYDCSSLMLVSRVFPNGSRLHNLQLEMGIFGSVVEWEQQGYRWAEGDVADSAGHKYAGSGDGDHRANGAYSFDNLATDKSIHYALYLRYQGCSIFLRLLRSISRR